MKNIVIISGKDDIHATHIVDILHAKKVPCSFLQTDNLNFTLDFNSFHKKQVPHSVWYRRVIFDNENLVSPQYFRYVESEMTSLFDGLDALWSQSKWIPKINSWLYSRNKIRQLKVAQDIDMLIPETLISSDNKEVLSFANGQDLLVKGLSSQCYQTSHYFYGIQAKIIPFTEILNPSLYITPIFFQKIIKYVYEVRVIVMNDKCYSFSIKSKKNIPYQDIKELVQRDDMKVDKINLDSEIESKILKMMDIFKLNFAAFDFLVTPNDEWIFLELNPNGQWLYLEYETGYNLSRHFIDFLQN